jgi:EPS-associated MarR family transcriptional regulator
MSLFRTGIAVAIPSVVSIQSHQDRHSMTSRRAKLHEDTNFRLMKILEANPDLSQRQMGKLLGLSFGGINYCLNALVAKGLVKIENFSQNQNKFGYVYLLTPSGIAEKAALTSVFLKRKMEEYEALKLEIAMLKSEIATKNGEKPSEK